MLINYDDNPKNSLIYTAGVVINYLVENDGTNKFFDLYKYCMKYGMEYSLFILTIDWLYLIGVIKEINDENEVIL